MSIQSEFEYLLVQAERQLAMAKNSGNSRLIAPMEAQVQSIRQQLEAMKISEK